MARRSLCSFENRTKQERPAACQQPKMNLQAQKNHDIQTSNPKSQYMLFHLALGNAI